MEFYTSIERHANNILYRGYKNGKHVEKKIKYEPTLYLKAKNTDEATHFSLVEEMPLRAKEFSSMSEAREFTERYAGVSGFSIFGNTNHVAAFTQKMFPGVIKYDVKMVNIFQFDIEVDIEKNLPNMELADNEITAISIKSSKKDHYWLLGRKDYDKTKTLTGIDPDKITFLKFDDEISMLSMFMKIWKNDFPDIITGWNVEYFDIQYIITRLINFFGEDRVKQLSPWEKITKKTIEKYGKPQHSYDISGITVVDFMDAFRKFGYKYGPQESYKLNHIAYVVLGEKKLSYEEYGTLSTLYRDNPQLYLDYALKDTYLIQRMEEETALIALVMAIAYKAGVNYSDTFGTVGIWETTLYRKLMKDNIVPPLKGSPGDRSSELVGGYVKTPIPGMYRYAVSLDLTALYPSWMVQNNMGPDTIIRDDRELVSVDMILDGNYVNHDKNVVVCANGVKFSKHKQGVIPGIIEEYMRDRKVAKTEMLQQEQIEQIIKAEMKRRGLAV